MGCAPNRAKFRIDPVGAAPWVRYGGGIHQRLELVFLQVYNGNLVRLISGNQEVALGRIQAAIVQEASKTWQEADADVCEAIDFCEFYAREALRYAETQPLIPLAGEANELRYIPLGAGAVISPWNFPCAILLGMTAAALGRGIADGSIGPVALLTVPFLLATIFLGFAVRAFFTRRETAMQVVLFSSLPLVFLSGFAWPLEALPAWVNRAASLVPSTTAIPAYLRLTRMGAGLADVAHETAILWALVAMYFPAACIAETLPAWRPKKEAILPPDFIGP